MDKERLLLLLEDYSEIAERYIPEKKMSIS